MQSPIHQRAACARNANWSRWNLHQTAARALRSLASYCHLSRNFRQIYNLNGKIGIRPAPGKTLIRSPVDCKTKTSLELYSLLHDTTNRIASLCDFGFSQRRMHHEHQACLTQLLCDRQANIRTPTSIIECFLEVHLRA